LPTTEEQIKQLEDKLHNLRLEKLLMIETIRDEAKKGLTKLELVDKELKEAVKELKGCTPEDIGRWRVIIGGLKAQVDVQGSIKNLWQQLRLLNRNIQHEEERTTFLRKKLEEE